MPSLLALLREETAPAHRQLEDDVQIEKRVQNFSQYRQLLESFYGYYRPLEARLNTINGWETWGIRLEERLKAPWLEHDLVSLGLSRTEVLALPECIELPQVDDLASAMGCAYVLEGSTLGGRHISKMLEDQDIPSSARSFFRSYGSDVGRMWKEFCEALEHFGNIAPDATKAATSARITFECLNRWLRTAEVVA